MFGARTLPKRVKNDCKILGSFGRCWKYNYRRKHQQSWATTSIPKGFNGREGRWELDYRPNMPRKCLPRHFRLRHFSYGICNLFSVAVKPRLYSTHTHIQLQMSKWIPKKSEWNSENPFHWRWRKFKHKLFENLFMPLDTCMRRDSMGSKFMELMGFYSPNSCLPKATSARTNTAEARKIESESFWKFLQLLGTFLIGRWLQ